MIFNGFGEHAIDFYDGLNADNSKAYWDDNVETYRRDVRAPMEALLAELEPEFGEFGTPKVFRPYRDLRFSRDKTPYKTQCGGVIEAGRGGGAYYVAISSDGLRVGGGCFHMEPDQLKRYRQAVDTKIHGSKLAKIVAELTDAGWVVHGERLVTKPRGFDADHPRIELLKHKSLYVSHTWEPDDVLHQRSTLDRVRGKWRQLKDINAWAADHVGVSEQPRRR